ncbi:MAG: GNAT family N-acetyltransferase [Pseudothermotoga sp.]
MFIVSDIIPRGGLIILELIKAQKSHACDFVDLVLMTGRDFFEGCFGRRVERMLRNLYIQERNLFSHECTWFGLLDAQIVGLIVGYSYDYVKENRLNTGVMILKEIGLFRFMNLVKVDGALGKHSKDEFYLSNLAIYPKFRSMGFGRKLVEYVFELARQQNCKRVVLDVERENEVAKALYYKMGFKKISEKRIRVGHHEFCFERMSFEGL